MQCASTNKNNIAVTVARTQAQFYIDLAMHGQFIISVKEKPALPHRLRFMRAIANL